MILSQAFHESAMRDPEHPALLEEGQIVTYADLRDRIGRLSHLYQNALPFGARVALLACDGTLFAQTFFALTNSGNPVLALNPKDNDASFALDLRQLAIKAVFVTHEHAFRMQELLRRENLPVQIFEIEKKRGGEFDTTFHPSPDRPLTENAPVLILRQEDSHLERKYCFFTHNEVHNSCLAVRRFYKLTPDDRMLTTMHWSHPFALTHGLLLPLFTGSTCAVDPESETVEKFVDYLAAHKITRFAGPPKFYFQLLNFCAAHKYTLPGVKSITIGMGSISLSLRKTYKLLKIPVLRCYGRNEAVWSLAMDEIEEALDMEGAHSRPVPGATFAVFTEQGEEIPGPGRREGRLKVKADSLATSYFFPDEEIAGARTLERFQDGWLTTDELARLEGEGENLSVAVLGKLSDMLLDEGVYLSPHKIDDAAKKLEGVTEAAGFVRLGRDGVAHFACALVTKAKRADEKEFLRKLQAVLPIEFQPATVHIVNSLPRDAFESISRKALQKQFSAT